MKRLTRKQIDRALVKLFKSDRSDVVPRVAFPINLYDYTWDLWSRTKSGRRAIANRRSRR